MRVKSRIRHVQLVEKKGEVGGGPTPRDEENRLRECRLLVFRFGILLPTLLLVASPPSISRFLRLLRLDERFCAGQLGKVEEKVVGVAFPNLGRDEDVVLL